MAAAPQTRMGLATSVKTRHPSPSPHRRLALGTRTSAQINLAGDGAVQAHLFLGRAELHPGASWGIKRALMPPALGAGPVRTKAR